MNYAEMVREFHERFGHPIDAELTMAQRAFRCRLIVEEWAEYEAALEARNRCAIAHELGDLLYVIVGTGVSMGEPIGILCSKVRGEFDRGALYAAISDVGSGPNWMAKDSLRRVASNVACLFRFHAIPLDDVFAEIHRSNMTKTPNGTEKPGKGDGYSPPDIAGILARHDAAVADPDEEC